MTKLESSNAAPTMDGQRLLMSITVELRRSKIAGLLFVCSDCERITSVIVERGEDGILEFNSLAGRLRFPLLASLLSKFVAEVTQEGSYSISCGFCHSKAWAEREKISLQTAVPTSSIAGNLTALKPVLTGAIEPNSVHGYNPEAYHCGKLIRTGDNNLKPCLLIQKHEGGCNPF